MKFFDPKKKDETPPPPAAKPPVAKPPIPEVTPESLKRVEPPQPPPVFVTPVERKPNIPTYVPTHPTTNVGSSAMMKGDIRADEDISIEGAFEGTIETTHNVMIGSQGKVRANIRATNIIISGKVIGNVTATAKVELAAAGKLEGNIRSPKLSIAESALFKGSIDMSPPGPSLSHDRGERERRPVSAASPEPVK